MAEYLAPGVYIEETSFRARSIEGVSTSTAGFVGPARYGPILGEPDIITSFAAFERVYGGLDRLDFGGTWVHNYLAHAVRAFFDNGGRRIYVSRVYTPGEAGSLAGHARADNQGTGVDQGIPDQQVAVGDQFVFAVPDNAFTVPDGAPLTFTATDMPGWLAFDGTTFEGTPAQGDVGTSTISVTAEDAEGNSATTAFHLTVLSGNGNAPFVDNGIPDRTVAPEATFEFTVPNDAFADVDPGDQLTFSATQADGTDLPDWLTFNFDAGSGVGTFSGTAPANEQSMTIRVTATDASDLTAHADFTLTVAQPTGEPNYGNDAVELIARYPGAAGNVRVTVTANTGPNALAADPGGTRRLAQVVEFDTVLVIAGDEVHSGFYDVVRTPDGLALRRPGLANTFPLNQAESVHVVTLDVAIHTPVDRPGKPRQQFGPPVGYDGLTPSPRHTSSLRTLFAEEPAIRQNALTVPIFIRFAEDNPTGAMVAHNLLGDDVRQALRTRSEDPAARMRAYRLGGGSDGLVPVAAAYEGRIDPTTREKSGLVAFEDIDDISIVAAPGYSFRFATVDNDDARFATIQGHLISHCERMRYRVAVLDSRNALSVGQVRDQRGRIDSDYAAIYYPWVRILDPITEEEINLPPSGFVAGIYARNDVERGVHKAPANEVVNLAIGFETFLNKGQQEVLNPDSVNCFRFFEGRGFRLWGARTISSDPEWKYVNVRRYFAYLERSIDRGTQWVVFEPNSNDLWSKVRRTIEDFLFNEWANRRLMGTKPDQAYFVRCDRSTMTQNDIDNGRLVCLIGVAVIKPAEFVIFRIGQWTGNSGR